MTGYWNRSNADGGWFVQDRNGRRWYRTGDLVSRATDGNLVFHGRADRRVKRHGYRIELGEMEAVLNTHPSVITAASVAVSESGTVQGIHVFITLLPGEAVSNIELRRFCAARLPLYMIPDQFHVLDRIPETSTGKRTIWRCAPSLAPPDYIGPGVPLRLASSPALRSAEATSGAVACPVRVHATSKQVDQVVSSARAIDQHRERQWVTPERVDEVLQVIHCCRADGLMRRKWIGQVPGLPTQVAENMRGGQLALFECQIQTKRKDRVDESMGIAKADETLPRISLHEVRVVGHGAHVFNQRAIRRPARQFGVQPPTRAEKERLLGLPQAEKYAPSTTTPTLTTWSFKGMNHAQRYFDA
ncbi:MAG: AMP-binding protein [Gemmatimonadaceae bacterium]|nr:AMP-binding protein [Gemmatimonadaceae bacterium]